MEIRYFIRQNVCKEVIERNIKPGWEELLPNGWGCGYAIIPPKHPLYGKAIPYVAHKEISYNQLAENWPEIREDERNCYIVGFHCFYPGDTAENCPKEYVEEEARKLALFLEQYSE